MHRLPKTGPAGHEHATPTCAHPQKLNPSSAPHHQNVPNHDPKLHPRQRLDQRFCGNVSTTSGSCCKRCWNNFLAKQLGHNCCESGVMRFFVKLADTKEQRTANEQTQQPCSKTMLAPARNDPMNLRLHYCSFSAPSHGFSSKGREVQTCEEQQFV